MVRKTKNKKKSKKTPSKSKISNIKKIELALAECMEKNVRLLAEFDNLDDSYTLHTTSQNPHLTRLVLAAFMFAIPESKLRVIAPDVGGGFGSKIYVYIEEAVCVWASKKVGRPVKWTYL